MDPDSTNRPPTESPKTGRRKPRPGSEPAAVQPNLAPQDVTADDIDPATVNAEEDDEARLPEGTEDSGEAIAEGPLAVAGSTSAAASSCGGKSGREQRRAGRGAVIFGLSAES